MTRRTAGRPRPSGPGTELAGPPGPRFSRSGRHRLQWACRSCRARTGLVDPFLQPAPLDPDWAVAAQADAARAGAAGSPAVERPARDLELIADLFNGEPFVIPCRSPVGPVICPRPGVPVCGRSELSRPDVTIHGAPRQQLMCCGIYHVTRLL